MSVNVHESPLRSVDEKKVADTSDGSDCGREITLEQGHMTELEVDLGAVLKEQGTCSRMGGNNSRHGH